MYKGKYVRTFKKGYMDLGDDRNEMQKVFKYSPIISQGLVAYNNVKLYVRDF